MKAAGRPKRTLIWCALLIALTPAVVSVGQGDVTETMVASMPYRIEDVQVREMPLREGFYGVLPDGSTFEVDVDELIFLTVCVVIDGGEDWVLSTGDLNEDGAVDVADVIVLINALYAESPRQQWQEVPNDDRICWVFDPTPYGREDMDCSADLDILDIIWLINFIFSGGYAPCDTDGDWLPNC